MESSKKLIYSTVLYSSVQVYSKVEGRHQVTRAFSSLTLLHTSTQSWTDRHTSRILWTTSNRSSPAEVPLVKEVFGDLTHRGI